MDKNYLLDLMVNVRDKMIPIDEAVETICALAETPENEQANEVLPLVVASTCLYCNGEIDNNICNKCGKLVF